jgi:predicted transcriptional regulator
MGNRDRHDIVMEILDSMRSRRTKTSIMQEVGLSYLQSKQYFDLLLEKGLLEVDENHRLQTTKKGVEFMEKCKDCFLCHWHKQKEKKPLLR